MVRIKATVEYIETVIGFPVGLLLVMERVFDDCLLYDPERNFDWLIF